MKTSRLRLKRIAELLQPERQFGTFEFASMAELKYFVELVEKNILAKAFYVILSLVNLEESSEAIAEFRSEWDSVGYRIEDESDQDLLRFRDQLRTLWVIIEKDHLGKPSDDQQKQAAIMKQWFSCPFDDQAAWWVIPEVGKIIAQPANLRAVAGRFVICNHKLLGRCANPKCSGRFFVKRRYDQCYCLEEECLKYGNRERNKKWRVRKAQLIPVATKGRKKGR
jgi:hypothetical protein